MDFLILSSFRDVGGSYHAHVASNLEETETLLRKALSWVAYEKQHLPNPPKGVGYSQAQHHNSSQIVSKLPTEILSNIFLFAYGPSLNPNGFHPENYSPRITSYSALSVSIFWRSCVISIPILWTLVWLRGSMDQTQKLEYLERLVARSKGQPFQLRVMFDRTVASHIENIGKALHKHLHRCRSLRLWISDVIIYKTVFPLPWTLYNLEELCVENLDWEDIEDPWLGKFVWGQPTLKILDIDGCFGSLLPSAFSAFQAIEYLELGSIPYPDPPPDQIGEALPRLKNLKALCWGVEYDLITPDAPFLLPSLERLIIPGPYNGSLLSIIVAPRLKNLRLGLVGRTASHAMETIQRLRESRDPSTEWEEFAISFDGVVPPSILRLAGTTHLSYQNLLGTLPYDDLFEGLLDEKDPKTGQDFPLKFTLTRLNLSIYRLLVSDEPRLHIGPRHIRAPSLLHFSDMLQDFITRRGQQTHCPPLHVYLDIDIDDFPILRAISNDIHNESCWMNAFHVRLSMLWSRRFRIFPQSFC